VACVSAGISHRYYSTLAPRAVNVFAHERQPIRLDADRSGSPCEARGHCGPFVNEAYYNAFPEPLWHGMGDCVQCGTTRIVADELRHAAAAAHPAKPAARRATKSRRRTTSGRAGPATDSSAGEPPTS
jgi:hypothetical protein